MRRWLHGWLAIWLGALAWGCRTPPAAPPPAAPPPRPSVWDTPAEMLRPAPSAFAAAAPYQPPAADACLPAEPPPKPGLADVADLKAFASLSTDERTLLELQGFAATPVADPQLDAVYRANLADRVPGFVTADAALYAFHRLCEDTRRRLDAQVFPARLRRLTTALLDRTRAQYDQAAGAEWKEAARRNLAWLSVAASLLGLDVRVESGAAELATGELQLIAAHEGWRLSRIFPYELDYSVFVRRDVYTATEALARYAEALTWFAATPFATRYENDRGETVEAWPVVRQELLLAHALGCPPETPLRDWEALADAHAFLNGRPRELGPAELLAAAEEVFGRARAARAYDDYGKLQAFAAKLSGRAKAPLLPFARRPQRPGAVQFRLLGPPDAPDEEILAELAGPVRRTAAAGLDVFAVLGHPRAEELLRRLDRSTVANEPFQTTFLRLRERLGAVEAATWQSNLYWGRLWAAAPLCEAAGPGHPRFQRQPAWQDRALLTSLAGWAALRHRTWLAVPQEPAAPAHIAVVSDPPPAYVEPVPELYARLRWLSAVTVTGLERHGALSAELAASHVAFDSFAGFLQQVAEEELRGQALTLPERQRLAVVGHELHWLASGLDAGLDAPRERLALIADVGRTASGERLLAGIGPVLAVTVLVRIGGKPYLTRGALLSYHELVRPAAAGLTDEGWQALLAAGTAPGMPQWAGSYVLPNRAAPQLPAATAPLITAPAGG